MKKILLSTLFTVLLSPLALADNQRYVSITHTEARSLNSGICTYNFTLDNGGGTQFSDLELTLKTTDMFGRLIGYEKLAVNAFGDSNATRSTVAHLELKCGEDGPVIHEFEVVNAIENKGGNKIELPLSIFHANNPSLALVSIQAVPGQDLIHQNFVGTWVTDKRLCSNPDIETDADYLVKISGDTVRISGWQYIRTDTFSAPYLPEFYNAPDSLRGWADFFQFAPDYSTTYGSEEVSFHIRKGQLVIGDHDDALKLLSCKK